MKTRFERDSMRELSVPADAFHGAFTQRAVLDRALEPPGMTRPGEYALSAGGS